MSVNVNKPILTIVGPTAVGKTELSLRVAERINAEIISADSRQVYRQINIGTAKPSGEQLARVRHHFINELDIEMPFSAGEFARAANERIKQIFKRNHESLVVGGSTLYLQALQYGLADIPKTDPEIRLQLQERLEKEGAEVLFQELKRVDPEISVTLDATKTQRLVRALEVYYETGKALSSYFERASTPVFQYKTIVLYRDRDELYDRIEKRVDRMLEEGLVDEVAGLLDRGVDPSLNALQTIGYREPVSFLQGKIDFDEMVRRLKRNTKRYARRQLTWFRRFPEYIWIPADRQDLLWDILNPIIGNYG